MNVSLGCNRDFETQGTFFITYLIDILMELSH
jgi:hypothetical protein